VDQRAFVLFLGLRELLVFFEHVAFVGVLFLDNRDRDFFLDQFVDHDLAVVRHRRAQATQRRGWDDVVVGRTPAASRRSGHQRSGVVEFFLFFLRLRRNGLAFGFLFFRALDRNRTLALARASEIDASPRP
jgi:hypothetical protein